MSSPKRRRISEDESSSVVSVSLESEETKSKESVMLLPNEIIDSKSEKEEEAKGHMVVAMPNPIVPEFDMLSRLLLEDLMKNDASVVASALDVLFTLLQDDQGGKMNRRNAYSLGAHSIVAIAMKKWPMNENIQAGSCQCMGMLAFHKSVPVVKTGAVEAVVNAMKAFPTSAKIQDGACCTLINTLSGCDSKIPAVKDVTSRFVKEMGGVTLILKAMERFPEEDDVRQCGLGVFYNLSLDKDFQDVMVKAGVLSAVVGIFAKYPDDKDVKEFTAAIMTSVFA